MTSDPKKHQKFTKFGETAKYQNFFDLYIREEVLAKLARSPYVSFYKRGHESAFKREQCALCKHSLSCGTSKYQYDIHAQDVDHFWNLNEITQRSWNNSGDGALQRLGVKLQASMKRACEDYFYCAFNLGEFIGVGLSGFSDELLYYVNGKSSSQEHEGPKVILSNNYTGDDKSLRAQVKKHLGKLTSDLSEFHWEAIGTNCLVVEKRPWGFYVTLEHDPGTHWVKVLFIRDGESTSLQEHSDRHEIWVTLQASKNLKFCYGEENSNIEERGVEKAGLSFLVPAGMLHRIDCSEEDWIRDSTRRSGEDLVAKTALSKGQLVSADDVESAGVGGISVDSEPEELSSFELFNRIVMSDKYSIILEIGLSSKESVTSVVEDDIIRYDDQYGRSDLTFDSVGALSPEAFESLRSNEDAASNRAFYMGNPKSSGNNNKRREKLKQSRQVKSHKRRKV